MAKYTKKICFDLPIDTYNRLDKVLAWGERNRVMVHIVEWMLEKIDKHGQIALLLFLRNGDLSSICNLPEKEDGTDR